MVVAIHYRSATVAAALAVLAAAGVRAEPACTVAAAGSAEVARNGTPVELPALLEDCSGLRVQRGKASVCVQDRRGRLDCRTLKAVSTVTAAAFSSGTGRGWLESLFALLKGDPTMATAVTRGEPPQMLLPSGPLLLAAGRLQIDFNDPAAAGMQRVVFRNVDGGQVVASVEAYGIQRVAASRFAVGRAYAWEAQTADGMRVGRFHRVDPASVSPRFHAGTANADAAARALEQAAWLQDRGFAYEARQALRQAGFTQR